MKIRRLGFTSIYANKSIEKLFTDGERFLNKYIGDYIGDVCHYFPAAKLKNILGENELLFSDIEFLNDLQEETNMFLLLKELIESDAVAEIHPQLIKALDGYDTIRMLINDEIVYDDEHLHEPTEDDENFIYNGRRYIFCTSKDDDCLAMWKYYAKNERYDALNIVFRPKDLVNCIISDLKQIQNGIRIVHGSVIYDDNVKKEILLHLISEINELYIDYLDDTDYDEYNCNIRYEIVNRFFYLLKDYSVFFKNEAYKHEQEYRFILELDNTNIKKYGVKYDFRKVGAYQVPYIKISFEKEIIETLILNPTDANDELAIKSNRAFLDFYGYDKTNLGISTIPLRY